jgi:hypothetical protein
MPRLHANFVFAAAIPMQMTGVLANYFMWVHSSLHWLILLSSCIHAA